MLHVSWSTLLPVLVISYYDYSFTIYGLLGVVCVNRLSVGGVRSHCYQLNGQQQSAAA